MKSKYSIIKPTKLIALLSLILLTGCNTTSFKVTKPDGTSVTIANTRFLWTTDSYAASFTTNSASLTANKSATDSETIKAVVQGAVAGMAQAAPKP